MTILFLLLAVLFLAFSNGANDNFKGVATLFGSRTTNYRRALWWATATTLSGSIASLFISRGLVKAFSGKGLVAESITTNPSFLLSVGLGAALTVMLATILGIPISTTHSLTGALVGGGLDFAGGVDLARLGTSFFLPLAVSPFLSLLLTAGIYPALRWSRLRLGVERNMCLCLEDNPPLLVQLEANGVMKLRASGVTLAADQLERCEERYQGRLLGFDAQRILDKLHFLSAGLVGFARGLNDTPKIVALLVAAAGLGISMPTSLSLVGIVMAIGGLLAARRVAVTMSDRIVKMNHGQGFTANLVTAFLVIVASRFGVPVSTTHVSCGSLFGLGAVTGTARWRMILGITLAWVVTLPAAASLAALVSLVAR
jgi:PiT family inorganic phosphate transporter